MAGNSGKWTFGADWVMTRDLDNVATSLTKLRRVVVRLSRVSEVPFAVYIQAGACTKVDDTDRT